MPDEPNPLCDFKLADAFTSADFVASTVTLDRQDTGSTKRKFGIDRLHK
jgi:hypothetical protein